MSQHDRGIGRRSTLMAGAAMGAAAITGFPMVARGQGRQPIKIGMPTILSGRVAQLGVSSRNAVMMEIEKFNAAGGLDGRPIEVIVRDSRGVPAEAARIAREMITSDRVDLLFDGEPSSGGFAVHEVVRETGTLTLHLNSETSSLSADPRQRFWNAFRIARQGIHDSIAGGAYAAEIVKSRNLRRWMTVSPDYAYGRDTTAEFLEYLRAFAPDVQVVGETWPRLFQPDYTENVTRLTQGRPQAIYSCLWAGDLVTFVEQASLYGLFNQSQFFGVNMADYTTLQQIKQLPRGVHSGNRYLKNFPPVPGNLAFAEEYNRRYQTYPTNWAWQSATAVHLITEALKKVGGTDPRALANALKGMTIDSPFGADGKVTMRAEDQTLVGYAIGWGTTISADPYVENMTTADWSMIFRHEQEWKRAKGWA
ncbi:ABC transporter substrate-binding protein [Sabulicella rubraurantiaca]|uniref:ABC transporter substrate-binding protein n=1 Tax=Sabulicella rubraurantiaca TaxID=2811429 RepID=UPI001A95B34A|nr:ABC transporter substrate-binding protein [Sabulicella rubraurantiaca]